MSFSADALLDRMKLKSEVKKWRTIAILLVTLLAIVLLGKTMGETSISGKYIARINIEGIILENQERRQSLKKIANDNSVKAVIVYINSPGGTMVGGEQLYQSIKIISQKKPVVAVMGSMATSGGYMAAIGAEYIVASAGTITGSIGVILQTAQVTELAKKLGIEFINFKSGALKGSPSPVEKISPEARTMIEASINDSYETFLNMVIENRSLNKNKARKLSDGRIFTGKQAKKNDLIDIIGGENEALHWLYTEKSIDEKLPLKDIKLNPNKSIMDSLYSKVMGGNNRISSIGSGGIMAIWNPAIL